MAIVILDRERADTLKRAPLTYERARKGTAPLAGYRIIHRDRTLAGRVLDTAADALMHWRIHAGAGLHVAASAPEVRTGVVVVLTLGIGRFGVAAPCRVLEVIDEPGRRGFVYGTLPGHPEVGEESFVLQRRNDDVVLFSIRAMSRPASLIAKLGGPLTHRVQLAMTDRYLRAAG